MTELPDLIHLKRNATDKELSQALVRNTGLLAIQIHEANGGTVCYEGGETAILSNGMVVYLESVDHG